MSHPRHLLEIHAAVLLFGLAGLFGKWIDLPATLIVLGRVVFAVLSLSVIIRWTGVSWRLQQRRHYLYLALLGILLAAHWITFFQSIKVSTVAVGLLTFSTFPIFTVFLEPYFFPEKRTATDWALALITVAGVALVVPRFTWADSVFQGALWGVASGATFAVLSILNRRYVQHYPSLVVAWYQDGVATLMLLPFLFTVPIGVFSSHNLILLAVLGIIFTALSHTLFINGLRSVPARTASIIASLEPVYGIAAAALLLGEMPTARVLLGGAIILAATTYASLRGRV